MHLTEHFTLEEMTASQTAAREGIDNSLPKDLWPNMLRTAEKLELIRDLTEQAVLVSSGYRCLKLNRVLKSKDESKHVIAEAADIISPKYGSAYALACLIRDNVEKLWFDQLIYEYGAWVHVSFTLSSTPRKEVLTIKSGDTDYLPGVLS